MQPETGASDFVHIFGQKASYELIQTLGKEATIPLT